MLHNTGVSFRLVATQRYSTACMPGTLAFRIFLTCGR